MRQKEEPRTPVGNLLMGNLGQSKATLSRSKDSLICSTTSLLTRADITKVTGCTEAIYLGVSTQ